MNIIEYRNMTQLPLIGLIVGVAGGLLDSNTYSSSSSGASLNGNPTSLSLGFRWGVAVASCEMCRTHMFTCKPKCTSAIHIDQICVCALCANHDAYGCRLKSHVYMHALNMHAYIIYNHIQMDWLPYRKKLGGCKLGWIHYKNTITKINCCDFELL